MKKLFLVMVLALGITLSFLVPPTVQTYAPAAADGSTTVYLPIVFGLPRTSRVSVASDGTQGNERSDDPAISADGRYVAFQSWASNLVPGDTNGAADIFVYDRGE